MNLNSLLDSVFLFIELLLFSWHDMTFSVNMSEFGNVPAGDYDIYLKINDPKEKSINKRCIRFANKGKSWNAELGANLIGSTTVR